jgi:Peptidase family S41
MALLSGSPQWRRARALWTLGARPTGKPAVLRVARDGRGVDVTVRPGLPPAEVHSQPPIAQLDGGVWYFDLKRAAPGDISANIESLARAPAVIFDVRGYPNGTHGVLNHLLSQPEKDRWMHVARIVRPALPGAPRPQPAWDSLGWELVPLEPRINGKVFFLTDGSAISYAESVMGYVEALDIDIVGGPTAGTNGDVVRVALPTGASVRFTGLKVTRHDGSRSHLEGIRPTIPIEPTVAGIRAGRDEVLERALEVIRTANH